MKLTKIRRARMKLTKLEALYLCADQWEWIGIAYSEGSEKGVEELKKIIFAPILVVGK